MSYHLFCIRMDLTIHTQRRCQMKQVNNISNLVRIKSELERRLLIMRYSRVTINHFLHVFDWEEDFLNGYGEVNYTPEWGHRFIIEYLLLNHPPSMFKQSRTVVRLLNEILENKQFTPCFRGRA